MYIWSFRGAHLGFVRYSLEVCGVYTSIFPASEGSGSNLVLLFNIIYTQYLREALSMETKSQPHVVREVFVCMSFRKGEC